VSDIALTTGAFGRWKMTQAARHVAPFWWIEPKQSPVLITPPGVRVHNGTAYPHRHQRGALTHGSIRLEHEDPLAHDVDRGNKGKAREMTASSHQAPE
jgi:hypothetical protein